MKKKICFLSAILLPALLSGFSAEAGNTTEEKLRDVYADNLKGDDKNPGTKEAPFKSINAALSVLKSGSTLHLVPNSVPYHECVKINHYECTHKNTGRNNQLDGTPEKPTVIDGHGAVIDGRRHRTVKEWTDCGNDVFSLILPNNAGIMSSQGYWSGYPIVFIDGSPVKWKKDLASLEPNTYFLNIRRNMPPKIPGVKHNQLFVKLEKGKTPADVKIVTPALPQGFTIVGCACITVRNLTCRYFLNDGFDNFHNKGFLLENVRGARNMDQGTSAHCASGTIRNSRFDGNAGCGLVDCFMSGKPSHVSYSDCVFENDVFRGGGDLVGPSEFSFERCIFHNNTGVGIRAYKSKASFHDCVFIKGANNAPGIQIEVESRVTLSHCTFLSLPRGIFLRDRGSVEYHHCLLVNCDVPFALYDGKTCRLKADFNCYQSGAQFLNGPYEKKTLEQMRALTGQEASSVTRESTSDYIGLTESLKGKGKDNNAIGASVPVLKKALSLLNSNDLQ